MKPEFLRVALHEAGHAIVTELLSGGRLTSLALDNRGGGSYTYAGDLAPLLSLRAIVAGDAAETLVFGYPNSMGSVSGDKIDARHAIAAALDIEILDAHLGHPLYAAAMADAIEFLRAREPLLRNVAELLFAKRALSRAEFLAALAGYPVVAQVAA